MKLLSEVAPGLLVIQMPIQAVCYVNNSFLHQVITNPVLAKVIVRLYSFIQSLLVGFNKHITYIDIFAVMIHRLGNTEHSGANMVPAYGLVIGNFIFNFKYKK